MPLRALENLVGRGLKKEPPDEQEIATLIRSGERRLEDAQNDSISLEGRFDLAYNAAHALSLAALRRHGYRSENRYLVFQTLAHTVDLAPEQWRASMQLIENATPSNMKGSQTSMKRRPGA